MSRENIDHKFPKQKAGEIEYQIAQSLKKILREYYRDFPSAVKWICAKTGVQERAVRNWYEGRNAPSSGHFIILIRCYPAVLKMILKLSGHGYLIPYILSPDQGGGTGGLASEWAADSDENVPVNVRIKPWPDGLNDRQKWFLIELHRKVKVTAADIVVRWSVTDKTAQRDIADLKRKSLIRFNGSRKTGRYEVME